MRRFFGAILTVATLTALTVIAFSSTHPSGDATRGKLIFEKRCTGCHAMDADREGPRTRRSLWQKSRQHARFYLLGRIKKFRDHMDRCDAGAMAERPGHNRTG